MSLKLCIFVIHLIEGRKFCARERFLGHVINTGVSMRYVFFRGIDRRNDSFANHHAGEK